MLRSNSVRVALILALLAVLAVEGYYVYRYYGDLAITEVAAPDAAARTTETTEEAGQSMFVHRATVDNITDNSTYLDDPLANGHPDAFVSVTQNFNPGGGNGVYNTHSVGVWYDEAAGRWAIFNQDQVVMPEGAAFNVTISENPAQTG